MFLVPSFSRVVLPLIAVLACFLASLRAFADEASGDSHQQSDQATVQKQVSKESPTQVSSESLQPSVPPPQQPQFLYEALLGELEKARRMWLPKDGIAAGWIDREFSQGRILGISARARWEWAIAVFILMIHTVTGLLLGTTVTRCASQLENRPGVALLAAFLVAILIPLIGLLLALSGVGFLLIPLLFGGFGILSFFGRTVMLAAIGRLLTQRLSGNAWGKAPVAILSGGLVCMALYALPGLGIILWISVGLLGLGAVIVEIADQVQQRPDHQSSARRPSVDTPAEQPPKPAPVLMTVPQLGSSVVIHGSPSPLSVLGNLPVRATPSPETTASRPSTETAPKQTRAAFWTRFTALAIDIILLAFVFALVNRLLPQRYSLTATYFIPVFALYAALFWRARGATIGGIVCDLSIVNIDATPLGWGTIAVRLLAGFLSLAFGGLGFFWIALFPGRQAWQDKIAGTQVVHRAHK